MSKTYVIKTVMKSEGEFAVELSFPRIERTRSSGRDSNKSETPGGFSGIVFCFFRLRKELEDMF